MPLSPTVTSQLDKLLETFTSGDTPRLPGSFISVVTTESATGTPQQSYLSAHGRRDITIPIEQDVRGSVNPKTLMYIASCTKSLIALTILQLIHQGVIPDGLDGTETIRKYIPEILQNGVINLSDGSISPVEKPLTMRHLISHTSGSVYPFKDVALMKYASQHSIPSAFAFTEDAFLKLPLVAQPGDTWAYGYGLDWAGLLLRRLCNRPIEDILSERIFEPLDMQRTSFSAQRLVRQVDDDEQAKSLFESKNGMQIHFREPDGQLVICNDPATQFTRPFGSTFADGTPSFESGGAGVYSTIEGVWCSRAQCRNVVLMRLFASRPRAYPDYSKWLGYLITVAQAARHPEVLDRLPSTLRLSPELALEFVTPYLNAAQKAGLEAILHEEGVAEPAGSDYSKLVSWESAPV